MIKSNKKIKEIAQDIKHLKKQIKDYKAEKLLLPAGDKKRIELYRKIKELKKELIEKKQNKTKEIIEYNDPQKESVIKEIIKYSGLAKIIYNGDKKFYYKYTVEQLQQHLNKIKEV
jgi:hypothetical protein